MMLIDKRPLETDALNDPKHKLHDFAKEYDDTLKFLQERYKNGYIRFKRPGYPRYIRGADSRGMEIPRVAEPPTPLCIPLKAYATIGKLGKHLWACCLDAPEVLPNGLWDLGSKRSLIIKLDILVNINDQPDLAFFLYKISPHTKRGRLKIVDPKADDVEIGEVQELLTERKYAIWKQLTDEDKLKTMARAYGVSQVDDKQPNQIRQELESILERNDTLKRTNVAVKGTREFLEEMRVTDSVLLRNFVQKTIDDKKLACGVNGFWKIGEKPVYQVTAGDLKRTKDALCSWLSLGQNTDKLQEFLRDLLSKEYLAGITDKKEWVWLAKIAGVPHEFKKLEDIKTGVQDFYIPV